MKNLSESLFDKDLTSKSVPISTKDSIKIICNRLSKDFNVKPVNINNVPSLKMKNGDVGVAYRVLKSGKFAAVEFIYKISDTISGYNDNGVGLSLEFCISNYNSDAADLCQVNIGWAYFYETGHQSSTQSEAFWDAETPKPNIKSFSFDSSNIDTLLNYISELCHKLYNISKRDKNKICRSMDDYMNKSKCMDDIKAELGDM